MGPPGRGAARNLVEREREYRKVLLPDNGRPRAPTVPTESSHKCPASQATSSGEVHGVAVVGTPGSSLLARSSFFSSCAYPKAAATIIAVRPLAVATLTPCAPALMSLIRPHAPEREPARGGVRSLRRPKPLRNVCHGAFQRGRPRRALNAKAIHTLQYKGGRADCGPVRDHDVIPLARE